MPSRVSCHQTFRDIEKKVALHLKDVDLGDDVSIDIGIDERAVLVGRVAALQDIGVELKKGRQVKVEERLAGLAVLVGLILSASAERSLRSRRTGPRR